MAHIQNYLENREFNDISEIWNIYKELKENGFRPHQRIETKVFKKALKMKIKGLSQAYFEGLEELSNSSKNLYNQALYLVKEEFKNSGQFLGSNKLDKMMKNVENLEGEINYRKLKAKVSQQILRQLDDNFISYFRAIEDWRANPTKYSGRPKQPNFIKGDFYTLIYNYQAFQIVDNMTVLDIKSGLSIKIPKQLLERKIKQIIINRKHYHFEAVLIYEERKELIQIEKSNRIVGIDLGVNNLATVVSNSSMKPFIINGRPIKSVNQFYNKNYAKYSS